MARASHDPSSRDLGSTRDPGPLLDLDADAWAWLLARIRAVLAECSDETLGDSGVQLRDEPPGRLAGGRRRRELCALMAGDEDLWNALAVHVEDPDAPAQVVTAMSNIASVSAPADEDRSSGEAAGTPLERKERERLQRAREERDRAQRRAAGEQARADRLVEELEQVREQLREVTAQRDELRGVLERARAEQERALERQHRRHESETARLREDLSSLRRADEERRGRERMAAATESPPDRARAPVGGERPTAAVRPGRPTTLPDGVEPMTREAADLLLERGRRVIIDGYNVTLQHQPGQKLEQQRDWLVRLTTSLVQRRGVRALIVFDGERRSGGRVGPARTDVEVRFTDAAITADDEIVFEVESTDDPVVVVTDDRELVQRVRDSRADVLASAPFVWVAR